MSHGDLFHLQVRLRKGTASNKRLLYSLLADTPVFKPKQFTHKIKTEKHTHRMCVHFKINMYCRWLSRYLDLNNACNTLKLQNQSQNIPKPGGKTLYRKNIKIGRWWTPLHTLLLAPGSLHRFSKVKNIDEGMDSKPQSQAACPWGSPAPTTWRCVSRESSLNRHMQTF